MSKEVEEAIKILEKFIQITKSISEDALQNEDEELKEALKTEGLRCASEIILLNYIKELENRKQSTIDLLKYRIADSKQMVEVCRKDEDVKMKHFYEGKKLVAEEILNQLEGEKK